MTRWCIKVLQPGRSHYKNTLELTKEPELSFDGKVSEIHLELTVNQRSTTLEDLEQARRRFPVRFVYFGKATAFKAWTREQSRYLTQTFTRLRQAQQVTILLRLTACTTAALWTARTMRVDSNSSDFLGGFAYQ